jgi:integrase/recombinase XerD
MSRGEGRVFRPISGTTHKRTAIFWWDYTRSGCTCGECDAKGRHREPSGLRYPDATKADVFELMRQRKEERKVGRPQQAAVSKLLEGFVTEHLAAKKEAGKVTAGWLAESKRQLEAAVTHFGAQRHLESIGVADVRKWAAALQREGKSGGTVRHYLNTLSNLYRRAQAEEVVSAGYNPVGALMEKPEANRDEAKWLEVHDAALLLEAARTYKGKREDLAPPFAHALVAAFLLTGGRKAEVLGLEVEDVSLDRGTVTFRPNSWRRLKTRKSARVVPLQPQLREILEQYLAERPPSRLLFPSFRTGKEALYDPRKLLDAIAERAGWKAGEITPKQFRHTYTAARLQTLDSGAPVSVYTVAKELGHGSVAMVERVYSHLGDVRHRSEAVEFRVEQHAAKLGDRLTRLEFAINNGKLFDGSADAVAVKSLSSNSRP